MYKVTVMMSTYNGEKYIREQIDSVMNQRDVDVYLLIRDDGSTDATTEIVQKYIDKGYNIKLVNGKNLGPALSFWNLLKIAPESDYYAFCDQDDVWNKKKLGVAIDCLRYKRDIPAMYYSNTCLVNSENKEVPHCKNQKYKSVVPSFFQLVMENNAPGCTMVWNDSLHNIAKKVIPNEIRMHDHLLFLICEFCGGFVYHDTNSYIRYRQHGANVVGGKNNIIKYVRSIIRYLGQDSGLVRQALQLEQIKSYSSNQEYIEFLNELISYKKKGKYKIRIYKKVRQDASIKNIFIIGLIILSRF